MAQFTPPPPPPNTIMVNVDQNRVYYKHEKRIKNIYINDFLKALVCYAKPASIRRADYP